MSALTIDVTLDDEAGSTSVVPFSITRWEDVKWRLGYPTGQRLVGLAERVRMLGERLTGVTPRTDDQTARDYYDWGHRLGRESAVMTLVGDTAQLRTLADRREVTR